MNTAHSYRGLTSAEAAAALRTHGHNELPNAERDSLLKVVFGVLREPMILLLLASALIYFFLGDWTEGLLLIASALLVVAINIVQDVRSERALQALRDLTSPRALVIRDGEATRIAARDVVPGDLLLLVEGDRISADAEVTNAINLLVDESLITGESAAVDKRPHTGHQPKSDSQAADYRESIVFSGALVVRGTGEAVVRRTGAQTEIGRIGKALAEVKESKTPLETQTFGLVRTFAVVGLGFCLLMIVLYRLTRGGWIEATLAGIALSMSLLPEEFPVVLSIFLALGARRLSARGILIRRMSAVEALGTVTTLCVDKTGTLTRNEMAVVEAITPEGEHLATRNGATLASARLLSTALLASRRDSFDPMDRAIVTVAGAQFTSETFTNNDLPVIELPIAPERPALTNVWKREDGYVVAVKGAPEVVLGACRLPVAQMEQILAQVAELARRGLRVLALGEQKITAPAVPEHPDIQFETLHLEYRGLLGFADPLRESIPESVAECYSAGMRVIMITGDYPVTARSIAAQAGIRNSEEVLTGRDLEEMNALEFSERLARVNVFARVTPSQKLELVELLKQRGEIVAMTGDGVNDAPALKAAHVGVAMGGRGTDVAREAAAVVLTSDDFPSLVAAIRMGRKTYDNIKKAMYFIFAVHFPIAGLSILPLLTGLPLIFYPIHIVLIELVIDPISSLVFEAEPEEPNIMQRPPRDPNAPIFRASNLIFAGLQGIGVLAACIAIYFYSYDRTHSEFEARTLTFATLLLANLGLALVNRSWSRVFLATLRTPNRMLWYSLAAGLALLLAITEIPAVSTLFHFGTFHAADWVLCAIVAAAGLTWFELLKLLKKEPLSL